MGIASHLCVHILSCVCMYSPSHVKTTDPLYRPSHTNNLFSKDHLADQVKHGNRILIGVQTIVRNLAC